MSEQGLSSPIDFSSSSGSIFTAKGALESPANTDLSFFDKLSQAAQRTSSDKEAAQGAKEEPVGTKDMASARDRSVAKKNDVREHTHVEKLQKKQAEENEVAPGKSELASVHPEATATPEIASSPEEATVADGLTTTATTVDSSSARQQISGDDNATVPIASEGESAESFDQSVASLDVEMSGAVRPELAGSGIMSDTKSGDSVSNASRIAVDPGGVNPSSSRAAATTALPEVDVSVLDTDVQSLESEAVEPSGMVRPDTDKRVDGIVQTRVETNKSDTPAIRSLAPGEQLTPAALASRQAHLAGTPVSGQNVDASLNEQAVEATSLDSRDEAVRATTLTRGILLDAKATTAVPLATELVPESSELPLEEMTMDEGEAAEQQLQQKAEQQSVHMADAIAEEQRSDEKLVDKNQIKVQQLNPAPGVAALTAANQIPGDDTLKVSTPAADNMLHSLAGGTVTAPQPTRAEAGNVQTIYAPINTPILQNDADKALAGNIRWMANESVKNATINLTPGGMGPITVSIGMDKEHMNVAIVAPHGTTREALESMLPRLREQLSLQGHTSINVDISDGRSENPGRESSDQFAQNQSDSQRSSQTQGRYSANGSLTASADASPMSVQGQGLVSIDMNGQATDRYDVYV